MFLQYKPLYIKLFTLRVVIFDPRDFIETHNALCQISIYIQDRGSREEAFKSILLYNLEEEDF